MNTVRIGVALAALIVLGACSGKRESRVAAAPPSSRPISYELRLGRANYQHYCQTCHGETGAGDGFNAFNLDPRPRDLSDAAFQKKKTDADLTDAVQRGGAGVGLSSMMPPWGRTLSKQQVEQLVLYLRSLAKH